MSGRPNHTTLARPSFFAFASASLRSRSITALVGIVAAPALALCQTATLSFSPIDVQLVTDQTGIRPNDSFTVGLHQSIQPGFHTYWRNPGTIGLPTQIEWNLPPGFKASPLQWSRPTHSQMADYRIWGYRDEALLLAHIEAPSRLSVGSPITLEAKVSWMCCGKQCYPGFKTLTITLPVMAHPGPTRWKQPFDRVRREQPRSFPEWQITATRRGTHYTLEIRPRQPRTPLPKRSIEFFGYRRQVSSDKPQRLDHTTRSYILHLEHEEFSGESFPELTGMLIADPPWSREFPQSPMELSVPLEENQGE